MPVVVLLLPAQVPMQFVMLADMAPMALRKHAFKSIGGMDEGLTRKGECGIISDWEVVVRMWMAGWQAAYHKVSGWVLTWVWESAYVGVGGCVRGCGWVRTRVWVGGRVGMLVGRLA